MSRSRLRPIPDGPTHPALASLATPRRPRSPRGLPTAAAAHFLACLALGAALASPARAGVIVEGRFHGSGMVINGGRLEGTFMQWIDARGTRTETHLRQWDLEHHVAVDSRHTTITRRDRGLTWALDGADSSYTEQTLADVHDIDEMLEIADTTRRVWQPVPGRPDTVAGFAAMHFRCRELKTGSAINHGVPTVTDLWIARGVPVAPMLASSSTWLINAPGMYAAGARARGRGMPADAITLRIDRSLEVFEPAQGTSTLSRAQRDSIANSLAPIGEVDPDVGTVSVGGTEITSIRVAELPAGTLELPRGFTRKPDGDAALLQYWRSTRARSKRPSGAN